MENIETLEVEEILERMEAIEKTLRKVEIVGQLTYERIRNFDIKKLEVSFASSYTKDIFEKSQNHQNRIVDSQNIKKIA